MFQCNINYKIYRNVNYYLYVRFQVLKAASMKFRFVFWDVLPCKIIVNRRFRGTGSTYLWNVGRQLFYTTVYNICSSINLPEQGSREQWMWLTFWKHWVWIPVRKTDTDRDFKCDFRFSQRKVWRWQSSAILSHVVPQKLNNISEVHFSSIIRVISSLIALIMEPVSISEMSVNFYKTTWHNIQ
jgi:hypothetical protein